MDHLTIKILPEDSGKDNYYEADHCPIASGLKRLDNVLWFSLGHSSFTAAMKNENHNSYSSGKKG